MIKKILLLLKPLIEIIRILFSSNKEVNITEENINVIKEGLDSIPQTEEVKSAKKQIDYISTLSEEERNKKQEEIKIAQKIVEEKVKALPITDKRASSLIDQYKRDKK